MPDQKQYTYEEVVNALEQCSDNERGCAGCAFCDYSDYPQNCLDVLNVEIIKQLKQLGQENEELKKKLRNGAYCI